VEDIQDFLRRANEKLKNGKSNKVTMQEKKNEDEDDDLAAKLEDVEDVEMSDSLPLTPAVVVQEA